VENKRRETVLTRKGRVMEVGKVAQTMYTHVINIKMIIFLKNKKLGNPNE
jgi:hypothetical protein